MTRPLSAELEALSRRFGQLTAQIEPQEAAHLAQQLRIAARRAHALEMARDQRDDLLEIAADLEPAMVAVPPDLARALAAGRSSDLSLSRHSRRPDAAAALAIPGTNVTVFPIVPRPFPTSTRGPGGPDDGARA